MQPPDTIESNGGAAPAFVVEHELGRRQLLLIGPDRPDLVVEVELRGDVDEVHVRLPVGVYRADIAPVGAVVVHPDAAVEEAVRIHTVARHQMGDDVLAEVVAGLGLVGVARKLLVQEPGVEHVDAHAGERAPGLAGNGRRAGRLFQEAAHAHVLVHAHHAEAARFLYRHVDAADRHVGLLGDVVGEHVPVVHLVDVVAGQDQDVLRVVALEDVHVLVDGIRGALIPGVLPHALRGRQQVDELLQAPVEEAPAALQVPDQAVRLVLRGHPDSADARVHAVGQRKIDDAELAAERHGRFGAPVRELHQAAAAAARQDQPVGAAGQLADEADVGPAGGARFAARRILCHGCGRPRLAQPAAIATAGGYLTGHP